MDLSITLEVKQMKLSIIIAYRADSGLRARQMIWTVARYKKMFPSAEVIVSEDKSGTGWEGFCKSRWINRGVKRSSGDILLVTDIDVILPKDGIMEAIKHLDNHCLVVPYNVIYKLNTTTSSRILSASASSRTPAVNPDEQKKVVLGNSHPQGIGVMTRENFLRSGGYDERFVGWGSEDSAFQIAARTMCDGSMLQLDGIAYHLKHPIVKNRHSLRDARVGEIINEYKAAEGNREAMGLIIGGRK